MLGSSVRRRPNVKTVAFATWDTPYHMFNWYEVSRLWTLVNWDFAICKLQRSQEGTVSLESLCFVIEATAHYALWKLTNFFTHDPPMWQLSDSNGKISYNQAVLLLINGRKTKGVPTGGRKRKQWVAALRKIWSGKCSKPTKLKMLKIQARSDCSQAGENSTLNQKFSLAKREIDRLIRFEKRFKQLRFVGPKKDILSFNFGKKTIAGRFGFLQGNWWAKFLTKNSLKGGEPPRIFFFFPGPPF